MDDSEAFSDTEVLNQESIAKRVFHRSTNWANLLKKIGDFDDTEIVDLNNIEEYGFENEIPIESTDTENMAEESDDTDILELHNTNLNESITMSNGTCIAVSQDVKKILEETLPILEEHNRNWREAGLERVLNSFNIAEIEQKVGGWMRRHKQCERLSNIGLRDFGSIRRKERITCIRRKRHRRYYYDSFSSSDEDDVRGKYSKSSKTVVSSNCIKSCCHGSNQYFSRTLCCLPNQRCMPLYSTPDHMRSFQHYEQQNGHYVYMRESECACVGSKRLCGFVRHLANSSSEDWLVENCDSNEEYTTSKRASKSHQKGKQLIFDKNPERSHRSRRNYEIIEYDRKRISSHDTKSERSTKNIFNSAREEQHYDRKGKTSNDTKSESNKKNISNSARKFNYFSDSSEDEMKMQTGNKKNVSYKDKAAKTQNSILSDDEFEQPERVQNESRKHAKKGAKHKVEKNKNKYKYEQIESEDETFLERLNMAIKASEEMYENDKRKLELEGSNSQNARSKNIELNNTKTSSQDNRQTEQYNSSSESENDIENKSLNLQNVKQRTENTTPKNDLMKSNFNGKIKKGSSMQKHKGIQKLPTISEAESTQHIQRPVGSNQNKAMKSKNYTCTPTQNQSQCENTKFDDETMKSKNCQINSSPVININTMLQSNSTSIRSISSESTFFANSGGFCNSTALGNNTATARQIYSATNTLKQNLGTSDEVNGRKRKTNITKQKDKKTEKSNCCTLVTSTTDSGFNQPTSSSVEKSPEIQVNEKRKRILIYSPNSLDVESKRYSASGRFKLTKEHLAKFIGADVANKFMKYYKGPHEFRSSSSVYYKPPEYTISGESDSEFDFLELCSRYGKVYEVKK